MDLRIVPPYSGPNTPAKPFNPDAPDPPPASSPINNNILKITNTTTPASVNTLLFETSLTPTIITANPQLKRVQQDLLILTSLNENETLHWRPSWFKQGPFSETFWTLFNPPNVVTDLLPQSNKGRKVFTRRMRRNSDPPPWFVKSWEAWTRYRRMFGIPWNFLCEEHVELLRMGLLRDEAGRLCCKCYIRRLRHFIVDADDDMVAPPSYPLYPEPQPLGRGRYILDPATYRTHLPAKFHFVNHDSNVPEEAKVVVVHSNGALTVELRGPFFMHASQWTHFNGNGGYQLDLRQNFDESAPRQQGPGRRWSYLPWTEEQEESCKAQLVVKLRVGGVGAKKGDKLLSRIKAKEVRRR